MTEYLDVTIKKDPEDLLLEKVVEKLSGANGVKITETTTGNKRIKTYKLFISADIAPEGMNLQIEEIVPEGLIAMIEPQIQTITLEHILATGKRNDVSVDRERVVWQKLVEPTSERSTILSSAVDKLSENNGNNTTTQSGYEQVEPVVNKILGRIDLIPKSTGKATLEPDTTLPLVFQP